jgi:hypothetical protein
MELQKKLSNSWALANNRVRMGMERKFMERAKFMILTTGIGGFRFFSGFGIGIGGLVCFILVWTDGKT